MFVVICGFVVAGVFTLAGMFYGHSDKRIAIWTFFVGGVFTLFAVCKIWADAVAEQPRMLDTLSVPTQTPTSNTNITSQHQSGGFTGVNQGTINSGPNPPTPTP